QPTILAVAGMDFGSVMTATCIASALSCFYMGIIARYPFALAPGMGENILFAFTICVGMGFSWQSALAMVFVAGLLFLAISVFRTREKIMEVFPDCLKNSIGPAIGLFLAFIGLQWGGIVVLNPATMVSLGPLDHLLPAITIVGVLFTVGLMAAGMRWALLIGILSSSALGVLLGVIPWPEETVRPALHTFLQLDFAPLLDRWQEALVAILLLFFLDLFDTVGTLVGVSRQAGFMTEDGKLPRAGRAFFSDALATCTGAIFGTSTITSYIESASGVAAGARTGLAAIVTGVCFLGAIVLAPVIAVAGQNVGGAYYALLGQEGAMVAMYPAVAPALIVVGLLMLSPLRKIDWDDLAQAFPAFLTLTMMVFGYGITEGIAMGCIGYAAVMPLAGRWREVHPMMYGIALAFVLRYAFLR
ncbi:MAG: NCS2 family permease, partial [Candidatus Hydrogenedentes bacterium]|nr:NCS2 family permease [Candidatus Hydrogenedentota bacterium]